MPTYRVTVEGHTYSVDVPDPHARPVRAIVDGEVIEVEVVGGVPAANAVPAVAPAPVSAAPLQPVPAAPAPLPAASASPPAGGAGDVTAPLPGTVVSISVTEGETVERGQELIVLEAMKMNNPIRATTPGTVKSVAVYVGQQVQHGEVLLTLV